MGNTEVEREKREDRLERSIRKTKMKKERS
jgi:hypothetical protein